MVATQDMRHFRATAPTAGLAAIMAENLAWAAASFKGRILHVACANVIAQTNNHRIPIPFMLLIFIVFCCNILLTLHKSLKTT